MGMGAFLSAFPVSDFSLYIRIETEPKLIRYAIYRIANINQQSIVSKFISKIYFDKLLLCILDFIAHA